MKKVLLFAMSLGIALGAYSQKQFEQKNLVKRDRVSQETSAPINPIAPVLNTDKSVNGEINRYPACVAADQRSVRREDSRVLSYNKELDLLSITFVMDDATYGGGATDIGIVYSTDRGETWSEPVVLIDNSAQYINDYPSGIVFNPSGNSVIAEAYGVNQSIAHVGSDWGYKMWSSSSLGGENLSIEVVHDADNEENGYWNQFGLTQIGDEVRCLSMVPQGAWGAYTSAELQPIYASFEGAYFDWNYSQLVDMDMYQNTEDGTMAWIGGYQGMDGGIEMAWSDDGQIGYIWMVGATNENLSGYQPVVFKSTDGGDNWDYINIDFLTDEMQAILEPYIIEATGGMMIPHIFETAGAVDYHGDLQMFVAMGSTSADVINYPDSLGYHWGYPGDIFNLTIADEGLTDVIWVDSLYTENVVDATEGNYAGSAGWQHRISVAKNDYSNEFFVTWTDTRDNETNEFNIQPDVFGWSRNVHTGNVSEPVCFTEGTLYEKFYFFTYGAERAIYDETTDSYTVPFAQAVTPGEFSGNGSADPVTINYISGIEFPAMGPFMGLDNEPVAISFSVSQNAPNPFNGSTEITVTTETTSDVLVEVSNMLGQTLSTVQEQNINGSRTITLHAENLEAGIYFYTVTIGSESLTKKMVIE